MEPKLTLLLMRHGKSAWDDPAASDHDRKLTKRGKRDAKRMGAAILDAGLAPDVVVSSSAKRARSTARRVAKQCDCRDALDVAPQLYHDGVYGALEVLARVHESARTVLLVGHNPTMEELVSRLGRRFVAMPTATVAVIEFKAESWFEAAHSRGELRHLWTPRDIKERVSGD